MIRDLFGRPIMPEYLPFDLYWAIVCGNCGCYYHWPVSVGFPRICPDCGFDQTPYCGRVGDFEKLPLEVLRRDADRADVEVEKVRDNIRNKRREKQC